MLGMEMKKHTYKVRPGYGSEKLLIEFGPDSSDKHFISDLKSVFAENNLIPKSTQDLIFSWLTTFDSPCGPLEVDNDEWGFVFVHAGENQDAINYMDRILSGSGLFQKEEVNYEDYAQPKK